MLLANTKKGTAAETVSTTSGFMVGLPDPKVQFEERLSERISDELVETKPAGRSE
jgi:hypothetical protein